MSPSRSYHDSGRRSRWMLFVLTFASTTPHATLAQAPADKVVPIEIPGAGKPLFIRFVPCPPGKLVPGDPRTAKADSYIDVKRGFHISETEITQEQYVAVLAQGEDADPLKEVRIRADANPQAEYTKYLLPPPDAARSSGPTKKPVAEQLGSFPVFLVTPFEAVKFCRVLEDKRKRAGFPPFRFRLPSQLEWQYACRACEDPRGATFQPHFSDWPTEPPAVKVPAAATEKEERRADKYYELICREHKFEEMFPTSQNAIVYLLDRQEAGKPAKTALLRLLSAFLRESVGLEHQLAELEPGRLARVLQDGKPSGKPNRWGLYNMHTNVSEWVFISAEWGTILSDWAVLERASSEDVCGKVRFGSTGGYFNATGGEWNRFLIWDVSEFAYEDWNTRNDPLRFVQKGQPGIRVLMEQLPETEWLADLRRKILSADDPSTLAAEIETRRAEWLGAQDAKEKEAAEAKFDFYRALAHYRGRDVAKAQETLSQAAKPLAKVDDFFRLAEHLVRRDVP